MHHDGPQRFALRGQQPNDHIGQESLDAVASTQSVGRPISWPRQLDDVRGFWPQIKSVLNTVEEPHACHWPQAASY